MVFMLVSTFYSWPALISWHPHFSVLSFQETEAGEWNFTIKTYRLFDIFVKYVRSQIAKGHTIGTRI